MLFRSICLGMLVIWPFHSALAQDQLHQWSSIDGPYWARGNNVALGSGDYKYLLGSDGGEQNIFINRPQDIEWILPRHDDNAIEILTFHGEGSNEQWAYYARRGGLVFYTTDGGVTWRDDMPSPDNTSYTCIMLAEYMGGGNVDYMFIGTDEVPDLPSVQFRYKDEQIDQWFDVGPPDDPIHSLTINDLATGEPILWPDFIVVVAGTDDGIYVHPGNVSTNWVYRDWTSGLKFKVLKNMDGAHISQWAAVQDEFDNHILYYSWPTYWDEQNSTPFPAPPEEPFSKPINDIAAFRIAGSSYQAVFLATTEGLYLLTATYEDPPYSIVENFIDLGDHVAPLKYDRTVLAVDYLKPTLSSYEAQILAGTAYNVYSINVTFNSSGELSEISYVESNKGTFISNVVALSLPDNTMPGRKAFTNSQKGIIKFSDLEKWNFKGLAFESGAKGRTGTDITTDFAAPVTQDYILASSKYENGGTVMRSTDGGDSWTDRSPGTHSIINAVDLDLISDSAYAAGEGVNNVWFSKDNGFDWYPEGIFNQPTFNDIYSDPDPLRDGYVYVAGSGNVKAQMYNGSLWGPIENGLGSVNDVFQFAKSPDINALYAATDQGVYKLKFDDLPPLIWITRTYGIDNMDIGTIVNDPNNRYALLAATSPDAVEPHIWASGDSGRSWIEIYNGDLPENPRAIINRLAASQDDNTGFLAGTEDGVYRLGDIFKAGVYNSDQTWGPGVIIVNGDVVISHLRTLTIVAPCTVYAVYDFDIENDGEDPNKVQIRIMSSASFETQASGDDRVVFISSKPTGKTAGDWTGFVFDTGSNVDLENCDIEYAENGIFARAGASISVSNSSFKFCSNAGFYGEGAGSTTLEYSDFADCGIYGAIFYDGNPVFQENEITGSVKYGVKYLGTGSPTITNNVITTTDLLSSYWGIYIGPNLGGDTPSPTLTQDSVMYFAQGGIYLSNTFNSGTLNGKIRSKRNGSYGLYLKASSPDVNGLSQANHNTFSYSDYGVYCAKYSDAVFRWNNIKRNIYGVYVELNANPDFGYYPSPLGRNSIVWERFLPYGNEMENSNLYYVYAQGNYWGEDGPQTVGPVHSDHPLPGDPIPGYEKKSLPDVEKPYGLALRSHPNPFNAATEIRFTLPEQSRIAIQIFDIGGKLVKKLADQIFPAGENGVIWDGSNEAGEAVSSGVYFYSVRTQQSSIAKKMVLIK